METDFGCGGTTIGGKCETEKAGEVQSRAIADAIKL